MAWRGSQPAIAKRQLSFPLSLFLSCIPRLVLLFFYFRLIFLEFPSFFFCIFTLVPRLHCCFDWRLFFFILLLSSSIADAPVWCLIQLYCATPFILKQKESEYRFDSPLKKKLLLPSVSHLSFTTFTLGIERACTRLTTACCNCWQIIRCSRHSLSRERSRESIRN